VFVYPHNDLEALVALMKRERSLSRAALVITDAVFSMDGDTADLETLRVLCDRFEAGLYVDEAHSLGVLGPQGRGLSAESQVIPDVYLGMLGKAFGISGAFAAGKANLIHLIENRARSFVFSTAPSPSLAAAALASADLVEAADDRRANLRKHTERLRSGLRELGYRVGDGASTILPVHVGPPELTMQICAALLNEGVFIHGIRPPTVPKGESRLRLTAMATHTDAHIDQVLNAFAAPAVRALCPR
jgi:7-keto-8-aminopelargonate synthetase-like enzyme